MAEPAGEPMCRVSVRGLQVRVPTGEVVLELVDDVGDRMLSITIGPREGAAIASVQAGIAAPRPQTHDLMLSLLHATGHEVAQVEITGLRDGVFFAEVVLADGTRVDARTSDGVALALRAAAPILCSRSVLERAAVTLHSPGPVPPVLGEGDLARFRDFLDSVEPDDFDDADS